MYTIAPAGVSSRHIRKIRSRLVPKPVGNWKKPVNLNEFEDFVLCSLRPTINCHLFSGKQNLTQKEYGFMIEVLFQAAVFVKNE
jgi:hypothetical protein